LRDCDLSLVDVRSGGIGAEGVTAVIAMGTNDVLVNPRGKRQTRAPSGALRSSGISRLVVVFVQSVALYSRFHAPNPKGVEEGWGENGFWETGYVREEKGTDVGHCLRAQSDISSESRS